MRPVRITESHLSPPSLFNQGQSHTCEKNRKIRNSCCCLAPQSRLALCDLVDCSLPGSPVSGILQARILEWVAMPSSRGSSRARNGTYVSCIALKFFTTEPPGKLNKLLKHDKMILLKNQSNWIGADVMRFVIWEDSFSCGLVQETQSQLIHELGAIRNSQRNKKAKTSVLIGVESDRAKNTDFSG